MAEELQELLSRINRDYLQKAEKEKEEIVSGARAEAARIVAEAEAAAAATRAEAEKAAAAFRDRSEAAARQAARDVVLALREELKRRLAAALGRGASAAMTPEFMGRLIRDLAKSFAADSGRRIAVLAPGRDADALRDVLRGTLRESFREEPQVFASSGIRSGFQVSFDGDDVYYDFSEEAIRDLLSDYLGGELAKLLERDGVAGKAGA